MKKAGVQLLEPIMKVEVVTPEENMGDVIGERSAAQRGPQHSAAQHNAAQHGARHGMGRSAAKKPASGPWQGRAGQAGRQPRVCRI